MALTKTQRSSKRALKNAGPQKDFVTPKWANISAYPAAFDPPLRAIRTEVGGTVNVTMPGGTCAMKFKDGETRYGIFSGITSVTSASGVEGAI